MRRQSQTRPKTGTITRADGTVEALIFEPVPDNPRDYRAIVAATGLHLTFHPGDLVTVDYRGPAQGVLIADRITSRR